MSAPAPSGKVALVTGGSRNIGRAVAIALAQAGADVAIVARHDDADMSDTVRAIEAEGRRGLGVTADVSDPESISRAVTAVAAAFGRINQLVCCAAIRPHKPLDQVTPQEWRQVIGVNLDGTFYTVHAALPLLKASGAAAIITFGGLSAHTGASERPAVIASKMGVIGLTRALAVELAADGVTANCVVPGQIDTTRKAGAKPPQLRPGIESLSKRMGSAQEVAAAVRFLAGPDARYITGQTVHVNGGLYFG